MNATLATLLAAVASAAVEARRDIFFGFCEINLGWFYF